MGALWYTEVGIYSRIGQAKRMGTPRKQSNNDAKKAKGNGAKRAHTAAKVARKKEMPANEATLRAWKRTYENRRGSEKTAAR